MPGLLEEKNSREEKLKDSHLQLSVRTKNKAHTAYGRHAQMPVLMTDTYADVELPDFKQFDPNDIKLDATIVAIGKRRTGKSWLFRDIMYQFKDRIDAGIVFSMTDELNKFWREYIPPKFIYEQYNPAIVERIFARQKAILNDRNLSKAEIEKKAPFFILLDDVISDERLKYDEPLRRLFVAGRHYKLFVLITTQYAKGIPPILRGNTDYIFIMKTLQGRQRDAMWEDYGDFLTKDAWTTLIDEYTEDNEVVVVDTSNNTSKVEDMIMWYKAADPGPFKFGSKAFHMDRHQKGTPHDDRFKNWGAKDFMTIEHMWPAEYKDMVNHAITN